MYKVLIIGDATVGKTSFMQRYVWNMFPGNYKATVGGRYMKPDVNQDSHICFRRMPVHFDIV